MEVPRETDVEDITLLRQLNDQLRKCCVVLCKHIKEEAENRIVLLEYMKRHDIDDKMSFDNKLQKLFKLEPEVDNLIKDSIALRANIRTKTIQRNQIEEEIKSVKKTIDVRP